MQLIGILFFVLYYVGLGVLYGKLMRFLGDRLYGLVHRIWENISSSK